MFGTFIFLSFSLASVAQFLFSGKEEYLSCNLSFGIGLSLAIIAVGQVSGKAN
jgi:glycerol uptake facilitator-like aquaporin